MSSRGAKRRGDLNENPRVYTLGWYNLRRKRRTLNEIATALWASQ